MCLCANSPVPQCHTTVVWLGSHPPEPQLQIQKGTERKQSESQVTVWVLRLCMYPHLTLELMHTHTATNRNTLSNKQNPYSLKNKKDSPLPPALLFQLANGLAQSRPPTLPVTVQTVTLYCHSDRSVGFVLCCVLAEASQRLSDGVSMCVCMGVKTKQILFI